MFLRWAGEAFIQVLRMEMALQGIRIDASMLNPGWVGSFFSPMSILGAKLPN